MAALRKKNHMNCRWAKLEEERAQAEEEKKAQAEKKVAGGGSKAEAQTYLEGLASRNQIFNMKEAFAMLSKELSDMMRDRVRIFSPLTHRHTYGTKCHDKSEGDTLLVQASQEMSCCARMYSH